jgi:hypothetical protein
MKTKATLVVMTIVVTAALAGCARTTPPASSVNRQAAIPAAAEKVKPSTDVFPPVLNVAGWSTPVPLEGPVNTAGVEDSPFITWDGGELYFFFLSDARLQAGDQLKDKTNGIWRSVHKAGGWSEPERVFLAGGLALDGCQVVQGDVMWFASARAGNLGSLDVYTARRRGGKWTGWANAGPLLNVTWDIDEFHIMPDGMTLYFSAQLPGGHGGQDIWVSRRASPSATWGEPVNVGTGVNGAGHQAQPFVTNDGKELWYTADSKKGYPGPAIWRSVMGPDGTWGRAQEIISRFSGEPCLDSKGNIYFTHVFCSRDFRKIEADIYVARKK